MKNNTEKGFESHAWVTINDKIVLGWLPDIADYKIILTENY